MNIFRHELYAYRKSILIWACSMSLLTVAYIFLFKGLEKDIESFKQFLNNMPDAIKLSLNILVDSISTLEGFYAIIFSFVVLCGAIQAMNLGTAIVSKEVREKTVDFLMTRPVSRVRIMTAKLLAALVAILLTNIIYQVITLFTAIAVVDVFRLKVFFMISLTLFFVQLMFLSVGIFISIIARKINSVISVSLSTVFGLYVLGSLGSFLGEEAVRYFSPFRYFDTTYIMKHTAYETPFVILGSILVIAMIACSYWIYSKKDMHTV